MRQRCALGFVFAFLLVGLAVRPASAAPILLGTSTLDNLDDLTAIQTDTGVLEWLDLTYTKGLTVVEAVAAYGADGFRWATGAEVTDLYSVFGITYASAPATVVDLAATIDSRIEYLSYLGSTIANPGAALGWIDDLTTPTHHTYSCISTNACGPATFVNNTNSASWPSLSIIGVFLVRDAEVQSVPEPSSLLLLTIGLALATARRRRRSPQRRVG